MAAVFSSYADSIITAAAYTGTAPATGYSLTTYNRMNPAERVLYGATSASIVITHASARADVFAIAVSNATSITLTNNNGMSETVAVPTLPGDRIPLTAWLDLRVAEPNATTRTATVTTVALSGSANIQVGGLIWLGQAQDFVRNFRGGFIRHEHHSVNVTPNDYGIEYRVDRATRSRWVDVDVPASVGQAASLVEWFRANHGAGRASLFVPDPTVNDALLGYWGDFQDELTVYRDYRPAVFQFFELNKGLPV